MTGSPGTILVALACLVFSTTNAHAARQAVLERANILSQRISSIHFNRLSFDVIVTPSPSLGAPELVDIDKPELLKPTYSIVFWGILKEAGASLTINGASVPVNDAHVFSTTVELKGAQTFLEIKKFNANGEVATENASLTFSEISQSRSHEIDLKLRPRYTKLSVNLGASPIFYSQPGVGRYQEIGLTAKFAVTHNFPTSPWSLGFNVFTTVMPFFVTADNPLLADQSLRFLGSNLRFGYRIPWLSHPWALSIMLGLYYTTTYSTDALGYHNFGGPQVYPYLSYQLPHGGSLGVYYKFSPVAAGFDPMSLNSREVATGAAFFFPPDKKDGTSWSLHLDIASLLIHSTISDINLVSDSFSISYNF